MDFHATETIQTRWNNENAHGNHDKGSQWKDWQRWKGIERIAELLWNLLFLDPTLESGTMRRHCPEVETFQGPQEFEELQAKKPITENLFSDRLIRIGGKMNETEQIQ